MTAPAVAREEPPSIRRSRLRLLPAERYGAICAAALALVAGSLLFWPISDLPPMAAENTSPGGAAPENGSFLARAPFDPMHRPETSTGMLPVPGGPMPPPVEAFVVNGILLDGAERKVMFASDPSRWFTQGMDIDGWIVRTIEPETVILTRGSEIRTITYADALSGQQP